LSKPILKDPRIQRNESIPEVYVVPKTSGAKALVIRDYTDAEDRFWVNERGYWVGWGVEAGGGWVNASSGYRVGGLIEPWGNKDYTIRPYGSLTRCVVFQSHDGAAFMDCAKLVGGYLEIEKGKLTGDLIPSANNVQSIGSSTLTLSKVWSRTFETPSGMRMYLIPEGVTLVTLSGAGMFINGDLEPATDGVRMLGRDTRRWKNVYTSQDVVIPASYNILGRSFSGTAKTVTETTMTLKDSVSSTSPKNVLYPLYIYVSADNPAGSTVTLVVTIRLVFSDGTERDLDSFTVIEGQTASYDYSSHTIAQKFKDGVGVTGVRLYAYVSATPVTGYEPTVKIERVVGFQF